MDWKQLNPDVIAEFRENGGKVARFGDLPLILLHTIDGRSGRVHVVPLITVSDGERTLIYGTNAGSPKAPAWEARVRAQPRIVAEIGRDRALVLLEELADAEREATLSSHAATTPQLAAYLESAAPRRVPVFSIRHLGPVEASPEA